MKQILLLCILLLTSCKVYQVDYNTIPEDERERFINRPYAPTYGLQTPYWYNWDFQRPYIYRSPGIIIRPRINKNRVQPRSNNNVRGHRGSRGNTTSPKRRVIGTKPFKATKPIPRVTKDKKKQ